MEYLVFPFSVPESVRTSHHGILRSCRFANMPRCLSAFSKTCPIAPPNIICSANRYPNRRSYS